MSASARSGYCALVADREWSVLLSDVIGDEELVRVTTDVVRSGWWSAGPRVAAFEEQLAAVTGARHALALANCTAALHLGLLSAGVTHGDEVITPSLTFVAAANAIRHAGATPIFCDIAGEHDLNMDPADLEAAIRFYCDGLGLHLSRRLFSGTVAELMGASSALCLLAKGEGSSPGAQVPGTRTYRRHWTPVHIDLIVDDLAAEEARLRAAGVEFRNDIVTGPGGSQILVIDPSGNLVELFQPARQ